MEQNKQTKPTTKPIHNPKCFHLLKLQWQQKMCSYFSTEVYQLAGISKVLLVVFQWNLRINGIVLSVGTNYKFHPLRSQMLNWKFSSTYMYALFLAKLSWASMLMYVEHLKKQNTKNFIS